MSSCPQRKSLPSVVYPNKTSRMDTGANLRSSSSWPFSSITDKLSNSNCNAGIFVVTQNQQSIQTDVRVRGNQDLRSVQKPEPAAL